MAKENPKFLGIDNNGDLVFIERINDDLSTVSGMIMHPMTESYIESMCTEDAVREYCEDLWKEAVKAGQTTDSLADYAEAAWAEMQDMGRLYPGDDPSYRDVCNKCLEAFEASAPETVRLRFEEAVGVRGKDYEDIECISCGAIYGEAGIDTSEWELVVDPDFIEEINARMAGRKITSEQAEKIIDSKDYVVLDPRVDLDTPREVHIERNSDDLPILVADIGLSGKTVLNSTQFQAGKWLLVQDKDDTFIECRNGVNLTFYGQVLRRRERPEYICRRVSKR